MRLLNTSTLQVDFSAGDAPRYAILSHRWVEEEVTLQDIENGSAPSKKGYKKLEACCRFAKRAGYKFVWIDTCCIDKSSSAELSEAINSMYLWYSRSDICYAYLDDASSVDTLHESLWFTRGWTLQELLAPRNVVLLVPGENPGEDWRELGTKTQLANNIFSITSICKDVLLGRKSPLRCNIAQRMAWVSERITTRSEDLAYCLLGLFDIQMAPIYGEGAEKAFLRLQREIMLHNSDQTIFLWTPSHDPYNQGLLATSPRAFCIHGECFQSKLSVLSAKNSVDNLKLPEDFGRDPYSLFTALDFTRRQNFVESNYPQDYLDQLERSRANVLSFPGTLGPNGLCIPLLVSKEIGHGNSQIIMARLDVKMALNHEWTGSVLVPLARDVTTEKQDVAIPNGLGTWRLNTHNQGGFLINFRPIEFERKIIMISQLSTSGTGSTRSATFAVRSTNNFSRNQKVFALSGSGEAATLVAAEEHGSFEGVAGFVTGYHCDKCDENSPGVVLIFGFGVRGPFSAPWCCVWNCLPGQEEGIFQEMELLHNRFGWHMRRGPLPCGKAVEVTVFQDDVNGTATDPRYTVNIQDGEDD